MDGLKSNTSTEKFKTDEVVMYFYLKFELLEKSYYKLLAGVVIRRYWNTCLRIIQDKVNKDNVDTAIIELENLCTRRNNENFLEDVEAIENVKLLRNHLLEIKNRR